jgi:DNA polymerase-3 subunit alpha
MGAIALTDHGSSSGIVKFEKAAKEAGIKNINGQELYLSREHASIKNPTNKNWAHLVVLAKNLKGWKSLLKIIAESNRAEYFYNKPRLSLDQLAPFLDGNLISFSGHPGSEMANILFTDYKKAYAAKTKGEVLKYIDPDYLKNGIALAYKYRDLFGVENFSLEDQRIDREFFKAADVISECLGEISRATGIPLVATADSHYTDKENAVDQRVLLCSSLQTTFSKVQEQMDNAEEIALGSFFRSTNYHIPDEKEMFSLYKGSEEAIARTQMIADMCENYSICSKPKIPIFDCPDGMDQDEYFKQVCRDGWKRKIAKKVKGDPELKKTYVDRVKYELDTLLPIGLGGYFLIVRDYIDHILKDGGWVGKARGSASGCLVSYLADITQVDPIPYNLFFERFYNAGRNSPGRIANPDIDTDFEPQDREKAVHYCRNKYGNDKVSAICNFGSLKGRSSIKEVLRVHSACSFDEMNEITNNIPDEAAISDQLQEMIDDGQDPSIIMWALENNGKELSRWCELKDDGSLGGDLAEFFSQAIRLEGCKKSQGKHASGYLISADPLDTYLPMIHSKSSDDLICGFEGKDLEEAGGVKFDFLSTKVLSVMHDIAKTLRQDKSLI